uniref:Elongation factor Ts, mitochondrial n=1 Tax=Caligus clemensi TaxID=344056 RepID=C1C2X7_CALCM|nr:Elongation factor Ts, mitochondrial precursor [Caligus clemensi]
MNLYSNFISSNVQALRRNIFTSSCLLSSSSKSPLAKLRKKTGYSLSICKKALDQNEQNLDKAMEWLKKQAQAEGWSKANKLSGRNTTQGLIGLLYRERVACMVELNCETDFVARNKNFHLLLNEITGVALSNAPKKDEEIIVQSLQKEEMSEWRSLSEEGKTLADLIALNIGRIGENIVLKRSVLFSVPEGVSLSAVTHPSARIDNEDVLYGRLGTILAYSKDPHHGIIPEGQTVGSMARQLCQHIIGMSPTEIGRIEDESPDPDAHLLHQDFLLDEEVKISNLVQELGITLKHFHRFEVGRDSED